MILTGRKGAVRWDPSPASPISAAVIISLNGFTLSLRTDYEDVSCFQDTNKVYVPGLRDVSGTIAGFWNSDDKTLILASNLDTPGMLELEPNTDEGDVFNGLAYMDADLNCTLSAPKISGSFRAGGPWTLPS